MVDIKLERMVISSMIVNQSLLEDGLEVLNPDCFFQLKRAFEAIECVWNEKQAVDLVTFFQKYKPDDFFTLTSVTEYSRYLFTKAEFMNGAKRLKSLAKCRDIAKASEEAMKKAMDGELEEAVKIGTDIFFGVEIDDKQAKVTTPEEHANRTIDLIYNPPSKSQSGIYTNFKGVNKMVNGGFSKGDLVILAAQTGRGKTIISLNLMEAFAMVQKVPSLYINTEMSEQQIDARWNVILSKSEEVTYSKIIEGGLSQKGVEIAHKATEKMKSSKFYSITIPSLDIRSAEFTLRRYKAKFDIRVAVVDYVGRMETQDKDLKEYQVLVRIAKKLKTIAQNLGITIIMVAQMNDDGSLQGAKAMENECDVFAILERPKDSDRDPSVQKLKKWLEDRDANARLLIKKNRIGKEGVILLRFDDEKLFFEEVQNDSEWQQKRSENIRTTTGTPITRRAEPERSDD